MGKLLFTIDTKETNADFLIEPDGSEKPNSSGYFFRYTLTALPSVSGGDRVPLGGFSAVSLRQDKNVRNSLERLMDGSKCFGQLPAGYFSLIENKALAQKLFILLSPAQRDDFIRSLNICLTIEDCKGACALRSPVTNEYVAYKTLFQHIAINRYRKNLDPRSPFPFTDRLDELMLNLEQVVLHPVRVLLSSEIDFRSLPLDLIK